MTKTSVVLTVSAWAVFMALSGCGSAAANHAADVAARQHGCPRGRVRVVSGAGNWTYWLDVCGSRRLYSTRNGEYMDITSSVSSGGSSRRSASSSEYYEPVRPRSEPWPIDRLLAIEGDTRDDVLGCLAPERPGATVRITVTEFGRVAFADVISEATHGEEACISDRLLAVDIPGRASGRAVATLEYTRVERATAPAPHADTPASAPAPEAEAAARAALTRHSAAILACAGTPAVAVVASWTADGTLSIALRDHAGSAVERCAQAAVVGELVPPGPPGSVVHAVAAP